MRKYLTVFGETVGLIIWMTVILAAMWYWWYKEAEQPGREILVPPVEQNIELQRLIKKHGLRDGIIEVHWNGKMYFERDGEECRLK
ncbi:MAG TPA: hypothetical protein ACFYD4_10050 [Candidatus Wunengus sp. YC61]|uniref:hypothetical protein n=1 Tax=Candidatus Wunengus sp. YC61 TaxID=3367698 RepID=UPI0040252EAC